MERVPEPGNRVAEGFDPHDTEMGRRNRESKRTEWNRM